MIRIGIVGSRSFPNEGQVRAFVQSLPIDWEVVSGGASGPDSYAEDEARIRKMARTVHFANWKDLGKGAGLIRNNYIVQDSDAIVAFYNNTNGTRDTIQKAVAARKPIWTITAYDNNPTVEEILKKVYFTIPRSAQVEAIERIEAGGEHNKYTCPGCPIH